MDSKEEDLLDFQTDTVIDTSQLKNQLPSTTMEIAEVTVSEAHFIQGFHDVIVTAKDGKRLRAVIKKSLPDLVPTNGKHQIWYNPNGGGGFSNEILLVEPLE